MPRSHKRKPPVFPKHKAELSNLEKAQAIDATIHPYKLWAYAGGYAPQLEEDGWVERKWEDVMADLLADMMHWCAVNQVDFATAHQRAEDYFEGETSEV